ncbi:MAG TPA: 50S ribosome-binding GTPase, partial [Dictyoglomaceae bacterium]|nr:50S ribosome-binding GTPase [Dictyoglomaceae bacterium]
NVGKSSLFNAIMKEDRAIVAPIPGTTRDYIEGEIYLAGYLVRVYDTAGLGIPQDILEKMGMKKTREVLEKSNLILFVLDGSEELKEEEKILFNEIKNLENKSIILVINKMDLPLKIDLSFFPEEIERVFVSAKNKEGIEKLEEAIERHLTSEELYDIIFLNIYHQEELQKIKNYLEEGIKVLKELPSSLDILGSILYDIEKSLGNILGEEVSLDIVDKIFANFCVGK